MAFRGVAFETIRSGASDVGIRRAEKVLGRGLPHELTEFFRTVNGGECQHDVLLPDRPQAVCFSWWHSLDEALAERAQLEDSYFRAELPEQFLPLSIAGGENDMLLINLSGGDRGSVLAWVSGRPAGWHRPTKDALLRLASDLGVLMTAMTPPSSEAPDTNEFPP